MGRARRREKLRAKFRATNAPTRPKTREHQRPESKTNQQLSQLYEICKTSIPGSNPGGASTLRSRLTPERELRVASHAKLLHRLVHRSRAAAKVEARRRGSGPLLHRATA